jgi:divalent metal cation (Fe/Co/Zn/Cd) transporter
VTAKHRQLVETLGTIATADERVISCDDIELSSRAGEIVAYLKITVPDDLTLEQAHVIETALEVRIRQTEPILKDVVVRALG